MSVAPSFRRSFDPFFVNFRVQKSTFHARAIDFCSEQWYNLDLYQYLYVLVRFFYACIVHALQQDCKWEFLIRLFFLEGAGWTKKG